MSDQAKRVLGALIEYDDDKGSGYPILSIRKFFNNENLDPIWNDYEALTAEEEKQVIKTFLEIAY